MSNQPCHIGQKLTSAQNELGPKLEFYLVVLVPPHGREHISPLYTHSLPAIGSLLAMDMLVFCCRRSLLDETSVVLSPSDISVDPIDVDEVGEGSATIRSALPWSPNPFSCKLIKYWSLRMICTHILVTWMCLCTTTVFSCRRGEMAKNGRE